MPLLSGNRRADSDVIDAIKSLKNRETSEQGMVFGVGHNANKRVSNVDRQHIGRFDVHHYRIPGKRA